ncbi:MAG: chemotaxis protein CheX [Deltaproteobacteria bacterium RBG_13_60_28]|nr:MAG: chemotaxis protein CheX [Deltaproteobacteria bacterium RBG_13_60_28]
MKVEYINPFLSATLEVLQTMAFMEARPGTPVVKKNDNSYGDVSGIIGITGPVKGSMSITFSRDCIIKIVANMLGEEFREINGDIRDATGELTNMISGVARQKLEDLGYKFQSSLPTTVSGPKHQVKHRCEALTIAIPFETQAGSFVVEVSFEEP